MNKIQIAQLKKLIPDFKSDLSAKHQKALDLIQMQYLANGRLTKLKEVTTSYIELIETVLRLDKEGYSVNALKSAQARNGIPFVIIADLNEAQIKDALEVDLSKAEKSHSDEIKALEKNWLDVELSQLISDEEAKLVADIEANTENKKRELLKELFT